MNKILVRFVTRIQDLRHEKRLSQITLSERTGLHLTHISLIELGKCAPNLKTINRLSKGLRTPLWEIFLGMETHRNLPTITRLQANGYVRSG